MLMDAIPITKLVTITVIEHQHQSRFKTFSQQCRQFKENPQFATQDQRGAPTQSQHLVKRITRVVKFFSAKCKKLDC